MLLDAESERTSNFMVDAGPDATEEVLQSQDLGTRSAVTKERSLHLATGYTETECVTRRKRTSYNEFIVEESENPLGYPYRVAMGKLRQKQMMAAIRAEGTQATTLEEAASRYIVYRYPKTGRHRCRDPQEELYPLY